VEEAVCKWLTVKELNLCCNGILKHLPKWENCRDVPGDYVEK
jgi:hypothetical protein